VEEYPKTLPIPLLAEYQISDVDPIQRTSLDSGRTRQRRRFRNVPTKLAIQHVFNDLQFELFVGWWVNIIFDGALEYSAKIRTSTGFGERVIRATSMYTAARLGGGNWRVSYSAEVSFRDVIDLERTLELIYFDGAPLQDAADAADAALDDYYTDSWR